MNIAVVNQKGGAGKSTVVTILAYGAAERKQKVLLVDMDPQGNLSYTMSGKVTAEGNVLSAMNGDVAVMDAITEVNDHIDIVLSAPELSTVQLDGVDLLANALKPLRSKYDYIIIDTPPAFGMLSVNALMAADSVIIPALPDSYSVMGVAQLGKTIEDVNALRKRKVKMSGIVITRHRSREIVKSEMTKYLEEAAKVLGTKVYTTRIPEAAIIGKAQWQRKSVYELAPKHKAVKACRAFINEALPM